MAPVRESMRFARLSIEYDDRVLRPRGWTELQSRWALELLETEPPGPVLELCAGAGHIGLLVAAESGRRLVAVDVDPVACDFGRRNAERAGLTGRVEQREGLVQDAVGAGERYALVVADPPWVATTDVGRHPADPLLAIDGGADGLDLARACVATAAGHLDLGGSVLLQLGDDSQGDRLAPCVARCGFVEAGRRRGVGGIVVRLVRAEV